MAKMFIKGKKFEFSQALCDRLGYTENDISCPGTIYKIFALNDIELMRGSRIRSVQVTDSHGKTSTISISVVSSADRTIVDIA